MARNLYDLFKGADHNIQGLPFFVWVVVTDRIKHRENGAVSIKLARILGSGQLRVVRAL
jgi:hypothetical protein